MLSTLIVDAGIVVPPANDSLEAPKNVTILEWSFDKNETSVSATVAWSPPCYPQPMVSCPIQFGDAGDNGGCSGCGNDVDLQLL